MEHGFAGYTEQHETVCLRLFGALQINSSVKQKHMVLKRRPRGSTWQFVEWVRGQISDHKYRTRLIFTVSNWSGLHCFPSRPGRVKITPKSPLAAGKSRKIISKAPEIIWPFPTLIVT